MRLKHIPSHDPCAINKINIHVIDAGYQIDVRPYNDFFNNNIVYFLTLTKIVKNNYL